MGWNYNTGERSAAICLSITHLSRQNEGSLWAAISIVGFFDYVYGVLEKNENPVPAPWIDWFCATDAGPVCRLTEKNNQ